MYSVLQLKARSFRQLKAEVATPVECYWKKHYHVLEYALFATRHQLMRAGRGGILVYRPTLNI
jgi:hypothetical protein